MKNEEQREQYDLLVSITAWNVKELLYNCLDSIFSLQHKIDFKVVVLEGV